MKGFRNGDFVLNTLKCTALAVPLSIVTGAAVAFFLWSLDLVTSFRLQNGWVIFLLPIAGVLIYWLYHRFGRESLKGNNLIIEEIHTPGGGIPPAMAPLVLISTLITHLFGGSAGREGTAVQMAGSISALFSRWLKLSDKDVQALLIAGVAAGFSAVFGTPLTGAVFAFEVLRRSSFRYEALLPVLLAAIVADKTCAAFGIHHTLYNILPGIHFSEHPWLPVLVAGAAVLFGLASRLFVLTEHSVKQLLNRFIAIPWLRPVAGGVLVITISLILGTHDYLGIGVLGSGVSSNGVSGIGLPGSGVSSIGVSIVNAFNAGGADYFSWFWKLLLTAITLGSGFKGGEVTPLFFIGATLGNAFATITNTPIDFFAGLGFIAVFAGATNTPIACTLMGIELFGIEYAGYFAIACFVAYLFSGKSGIYSAQGERRAKYF